MQSLFLYIFDFFEKRKAVYWLCFFLVFALSIIGASRIRLVEDISQAIPQDPSVEAMSDVLNKTKAGEQVVFTLSFRDTGMVHPDSLISLQQSLQQKLEEAGKGYIKGIKAAIDDENERRFAGVALAYLPLFLDKHDYRTIDSLLEPGRIRETLERERRLLLSPAGAVAKEWIAADPVGILPLAFRKLQMLGSDPNYQLYNGYIFSKDDRKLTFFLEPLYPASETGKNKEFFERLDRMLEEWGKAQPHLSTIYFGGPAVAVGNALQMRNDTILTLSITVVLLLLLTWYIFRRKRAPFLLMMPVLFGALFGLAVTAAVQSAVSAIALGAGAVILGIAIDFSVHFMGHSRKHPDMRDNVKTLVSPLTLGALTTIGAFLALRFAAAPLLRDLGLFAASGLAGASLFTLIFLPHLLKGMSPPKRSARENIIDTVARLRPERNKWLLLLVIIATPVFWYFSGKVQFDSDLMHLNYLSPRLKEAQDAMSKDNAYMLSSVFIVAKDGDESAATRKLEAISGLIDRLREQGKVRSSVNPAVILPSLAEQKVRIARWNAYWTPSRREQVLQAVGAAAAAAGFSENAFDAFQTTVGQSYTVLDDSARQFLKTLIPSAVNEREGVHYAIASLKVEPGARKEVFAAFRAHDQVTVTDNQSVSERLLTLLGRDFNKILFCSGALVFIALLIAYGRIELALISFLPMALTWVWILGIMGLLGLKFNIVNIIISTLIFGLGDDYSIFMMDSLMEQYRTGKSKISAARSAVYLSVLTTVIGLGTLIFARHPALQSIAPIAIVGLLSVVFVSQVLQPFLFDFIIQKRADKGFMPFTAWSLVKSAFSFLYFFTGCLIVTLCGLVLIGLKPFGKDRSKYVFHFILSRYTGSVMYIMANVRKRIIIPDPAVFRKPAVYIANHSSFLDILLTTMMHPRLVLLTNKWVWRSPVFGKIVRMAEYYPVADGAEQSIEPLRDLVRRGYGIVVFPEGTRSYDGTIGRFHKGAFYIAEQLDLDIVPVLLHGAGYTMQKGDWLLKDGTTTVKVLPPIKPDDVTFGAGYSVRARQIGKRFREQYAEEKRRRETPVYFKEQLIKSHIYKGPVLEWYCRIKSRLEYYYEPFHRLLREEGRFYDLGCGYGFMTFMLHWSSPARSFTGIDYDEEKISTARHNYTLKTRGMGAATFGKLRFEAADVTTCELQSCDGIIISDVLHYLLPPQQEALLERSYEALRDGGVLILREGVEELKERHKGTKLTELFSTRILKFNKVQNDLHFIRKQFIEEWAAQKGLHLETLDMTRKTSNLIFVLRKHKA